MSHRAPRDVIGLKVAELPLWLDARGTGIDMGVPACHRGFLTDGTPHGGLVLTVGEGRPTIAAGWQPLYHPSDTWELWRDEQGRYVFVAPVVSPPRRQVVVDVDFGAGQVVGEFASHVDGRRASYPLEDVEHVLFVNWLAGCGDTMLHAAGVAVDGAGYCFAGAAGAGKSTLAGHLAKDPSVTVLGEDQVILRYLNGRFWIFGTPWHLNPAMCSAGGAPLAKVFFLDRKAAVPLASVSPLDAVTHLLETAFVPYYRPEAVSAILERFSLLAQSVPVCRLSYRLGTDALRLVTAA